MILVIWGLVLLTSLATGFALAVRHEARVATDVTIMAQADAAMIAGTNQAILALASPDPENRWKADRQSHEVEWPGASIIVQVQSESGRIDINRASQQLLTGLFEQLFEEKDAQALADAVLDWRDRDDRARAAGAEEDAYRSDGRDYGPANAPFVSINELGRVMGFDGEMTDLARPYLTVYAKRAKVHAASADLVVLTAIPGVSQTEAETFIAQREQVAADEGRIDFSILRGGKRYLNMNAELRMFALDTQVTLADGFQKREYVVVELNRQTGLRILARESRRPYPVGERESP